MKRSTVLVSAIVGILLTGCSSTSAETSVPMDTIVWNLECIGTNPESPGEPKADSVSYSYDDGSPGGRREYSFPDYPLPWSFSVHLPTKNRFLVLDASESITCDSLHAWVTVNGRIVNGDGDVTEGASVSVDATTQ